MSLQSSVAASRSWCVACIEGWDQFWFTPRLPHTLAALRIITGVMLLYSHLVLASDLSSFLGDQAWVNNDTARQLHDGAFGFSDLGRSYLWYISSPLLLWLHHGLMLAVAASFAAGFMTRITGPAAWFLQLMYLHRLTGALFGFDQIVTYSTMYLMLAPCGSCYSVDAWLRTRFADRRAGSRWFSWLWPDATPSVAANVATRLFQLHLCTIYLFGGLAKARGESWWDGTAMWYSVGNYEYQSIDMTWIANYPRVFSALTHVTLFWEVFYCALVWPKMTRPIALGLAVAVHAGIAAFLGMITFGVMMIAANMIFVRPETLLWLIGRDDSHADQASDNQQHEDEALEEKKTDAQRSAEAAQLKEQTAKATGEQVQDAGTDDMELDTEFGEFSLEVMGLEELSQESNASDILQRALDHESSASGILDNLAAREAALERREQRLRDANQTLKDKKQRLNERLDKFNDRVARLRERESKIKQLVGRKRGNKKTDSDGDET